jgi:hypothetical protein
VVDRVDRQPEKPVLDPEQEAALLVVESRIPARGLHGRLSYPVGGIIARADARRVGRVDQRPRRPEGRRLNVEPT